LIKESVIASSQIEQNLRVNQTKVETYSREVQRDYEKKISSITKIYDKFIVQLFHQKDSFLKKIKDIHNQEMQRCEETLKNISEQVIFEILYEF